MKANKFKFGLLSAAAVLGLGVFSSCSKDFQGDIDGINNRIDKLTTSLDEVKSGLKDGKAIEDVVTSDNGVVIKMSDGKQYTITNGKDGKDGTVIKVGDDGFWYIDGEKTEYPAKGIKGDKGDKGDAGVAGPQGPKGDKGDAGVYYEPNKDGYWYKVDPANGEEGVKTEMKWLPEGTVTAVYENGVVTLYNVKGYEGGLKLGSIAITKLTAIADVVADKGGALPLVDFSPLKTDCGTITPTATVKYLVSPMNATRDQIKSVDFLYNNPKVADTRSIDDAIKSTAEIVSLEKGILTVKAGVDASKLGKKPGTMDQINLLVTLKSGQTITSDWVKVTADKTLDGSDIALALKNKEANYPAFPKTLGAAKDAAKALTDKSIIELEYSKTMNLKDTVIARLGQDLDKLADVYGLSNDNIKFDLLDEKGKTIVFERGDNDTDQQKFIVLDEATGKIRTRVYDIDGANPASVDRTPIVHVALTTTKDGKLCIVAEGFIVIKIVKDATPAIPPTIIKAGSSFVLGCDDLKQLVGTKQMNEEIYAKARLPKADFHKYYTWKEDAPAKDQIGTIVEKQDPKNAESYNLEWTVTNEEAWKALGDENKVSIKRSGTYTNGENVIKVTFTAELNRPYVDLKSLKIDNYWYGAEGGEANMVKFNTAVPELGSEDPAKCTFKTYFASVLKSDKDKKKVEIGGVKPSVTDLQEIKFVFSDDQSFSKAFDKKGYTMKPSADGMTLLAVKAGKEYEIAKIDNNPAGQSVEYMNNDVAKELLNVAPENVHARITLKAINNCGKELQIKGSDGTFIVRFVRPVSMTVAAADNYVDAVDYGAKGSFIDVHDLANLYDWRNYAKKSEKYYFQNNQNYYKYYDVKSIKVDVENVKVEDLTINGEEQSDLTNTGVELTQMAPTANMIAKYPELKNTSADGLLMYKNNGAALNKPFTLILPVTVEYKWGKVVENVKVKVMPTDETAPAAR